MSFARYIILAVVVLLVGSCSKQPTGPSASTTTVFSRAEVRLALPYATLGDASYAQVNSAWLKAFYSEFRDELFRQGVTKWDARFDCNHFASYYAALAQTKFYAANFQSWTTAQTLAVGPFWYQSPRGYHAIVLALTERGPVFIEPQTGAELRLSPAELASVGMCWF